MTFQDDYNRAIRATEEEELAKVRGTWQSVKHKKSSLPHGYISSPASLWASLAFGGLPLPGTLRIASNDLREYKASFDIGFSPAVCSLTLTADGSISSLSAISLTVKNSSPFISISYIIGFFAKIITCSNNSLNKHIVKTKKYYQKQDLYIDLISYQW